MAELKYGDRVRLKHGATGRYVGHGFALSVSAQDNDLFLDPVVPVFDAAGALREPHPTLPVPSDDAVAGAAAACRYWVARTKEADRG